MEKEKDKRPEKIKVRTIVAALGLVFLAYVVAVGVAVFSVPLTSEMFKNKLIRKTVGLVPYPAAFAGAKMITADDLLFELGSVKRFYESQDYSEVGMRVDFSTEEGKKRLKIKEREILNKLIEDRIIEAEARKRNISISREMVDQEVDRKLKEYGTGEYLKENLERLYGWDQEDFKERIVRPDLYKERLLESFKKNEGGYGSSREKIDGAKSDLDSGKDFSEVAKDISEGDSAKDGGALGWFRADQMVPEVAVTVFPLEKGAVSGVIESPIGYHIVKVEDKKNEDGADMVKVSQIFVRVESFGDWLLEAQKKYAIRSALFEFKWNKEETRLDFRDQDMLQYEDEIRSNPTNDPSMIF